MADNLFAAAGTQRRQLAALQGRVDDLERQGAVGSPTVRAADPPFPAFMQQEDELFVGQDGVLAQLASSLGHSVSSSSTITRTVVRTDKRDAAAAAAGAGAGAGAGAARVWW